MARSRSSGTGRRRWSGHRWILRTGGSFQETLGVLALARWVYSLGSNPARAGFVLATWPHGRVSAPRRCCAPSANSSSVGFSVAKLRSARHMVEDRVANSSRRRCAPVVGSHVSSPGIHCYAGGAGCGDVLSSMRAA
mmetsp:Transcript_84707/g.236399  ORF Transcript_84707/g.236399 Transcript_84707/m.236399 type:complete len:137 (-) Transcript_84707:65-475(-)